MLTVINFKKPVRTAYIKCFSVKKRENLYYLHQCLSSQKKWEVIHQGEISGSLEDGIMGLEIIIFLLTGVLQLNYIHVFISYEHVLLL